MAYQKRFSGAHPDEDTLEAFALGRAEDESVLLHVSRCEHCADLVNEVRLLRCALSRLQQTGPTVLFQHDTPNGLIRASSECNSGRCVAKLVGADIDCSTFSVDTDEAIRWCSATFAEMFPHHKCGEACRTRFE